jgi:hypothetical protein
MSQTPTFLVAFGPWNGRPDRFALTDALRSVTATSVGVPPRFHHHDREVFVDLLNLPGLLAALQVGCRGSDWACAVFLLPTPNPTSAGLRVLRQARRVPWGVKVRRDHRDPRVDAVQATLGLHVTTLRQRTERQWAAIDAVRRCGSATAAAAELGCSVQAVSKHVRLSHLRATFGTGTILHTLLNEHPGPAYFGSSADPGR